MRIIILILVFSVGSIFLLFKKEETVENVKKEEILKKVEVEDFIEKKFSKVIKLRGFSNASRIVILKSQVEGRISSKQFDKGKFYKAGTQLLIIDPEDKVAKVKEMEALLNQRKKEYEVAESLFQKGFRSEVKLSQSRTNFENALAQFEKSQVELNNTKVSMPFDSSIDESYVELGDYLKKGDPIAKIVDLDPIFINTSANEKEIINIKLNQNASVKIGNMLLEGTVNYISKTSDQNTRNFKIQVKVMNNQFKILSGLSSEIEIKSKPTKAFFIPSSLITLNNAGEIGIKIIKNKRVKFIPVYILSDNGDGYWINIKDKYMKNSLITIITQGQDFTVDGEKVEIIKNND
tara:strand:+ start:163 stop:1209 length:1047 start_codon:yes stop_codon:yes gene_type:complete